MTEILDHLWTFTGPRLRMIRRDSLLSRQSGAMSSLQGLSRDAVLVSIITNNRQERKVESLVDRLGEDITWRTREVLLTRYGRMIFSGEQSCYMQQYLNIGQTGRIEGDYKFPCFVLLGLKRPS